MSKPPKPPEDDLPPPGHQEQFTTGERFLEYKISELEKQQADIRSRFEAENATEKAQITTLDQTLRETIAAFQERITKLEATKDVLTLRLSQLDDEGKKARENENRAWAFCKTFTAWFGTISGILLVGNFAYQFVTTYGVQERAKELRELTASARDIVDKHKENEIKTTEAINGARDEAVNKIDGKLVSFQNDIAQSKRAICVAGSVYDVLGLMDLSHRQLADSHPQQAIRYADQAILALAAARTTDTSGVAPAPNPASLQEEEPEDVSAPTTPSATTDASSPSKSGSPPQTNAQRQTSNDPQPSCAKGGDLQKSLDHLDKPLQLLRAESLVQLGMSRELLQVAKELLRQNCTDCTEANHYKGLALLDFAADENANADARKKYRDAAITELSRASTIAKGATSDSLLLTAAYFDAGNYGRAASTAETYEEHLRAASPDGSILTAKEQAEAKVADAWRQLATVAAGSNTVILTPVVQSQCRSIATAFDPIELRVLQRLFGAAKRDHKHFLNPGETDAKRDEVVRFCNSWIAVLQAPTPPCNPPAIEEKNHTSTSTQSAPGHLPNETPK